MSKLRSTKSQNQESSFAELKIYNLTLLVIDVLDNNPYSSAAQTLIVENPFLESGTQRSQNM